MKRIISLVLTLLLLLPVLALADAPQGVTVEEFLASYNEVYTMLCVSSNMESPSEPITLAEGVDAEGAAILLYENAMGTIQVRMEPETEWIAEVEMLTQNLNDPAAGQVIALQMMSIIAGMNPTMEIGTRLLHASTLVMNSTTTMDPSQADENGTFSATFEDEGCHYSLVASNASESLSMFSVWKGSQLYLNSEAAQGK